MAGVIPNGAEVLAANYYVNKAAPENLIAKLFSNNMTPAETDVVGALTECTGSGYASKTLTGASWTTTSGAPTSTAYAAQVWTLSGALTAYGYYFVRATGGELMGHERFSDGPDTTPAGGGTMTVTPTLQFGD